MKLLQTAVLLSLTGVSLATPGNIYCRDEDGKFVDWYVIYKIPQISKSKETLSGGTGYMYITSEQTDNWTYSVKTIDGLDSITGQTLNKTYSPGSENTVIFYNDQAPSINRERASDLYKYGHTKGVIAADSTGGFWLVHSIPHFPPSKTYDYPRTGHKFGQSALCISLNAKNLGALGDVLKFNFPQFYKTRWGSNAQTNFPKLFSTVSKPSKVKNAPYNFTVTIESMNGKLFNVFAKSSKYSEDLYEWVAQTLETNLYTETWQNEPHPLPSSCSRSYEVMNIEALNITDKIQFSSHNDHSKWAISDNAVYAHVCIGDINRAVPQEVRGGGTVCFSSLSSWTAYQKIIKSIEKCNDTAKKIVMLR